MWQFLLGRMIEKNSIRINSANCIQVRYKNFECNKCVNDCPHNSIEVNNSEVKIDELSCNNCGICAHSCPTKTFHIDNEGIFEYEKMMSNKSLASFTCGKQGDSRLDIILPCLKNLSLELLMVAALKKIPIQVYWNPAICNKCEINFNEEDLLEIIDVWNRQSNLENKALILHDKSFNNNHYKNVSRREFFTVSKHNVKQQIGDFIFDSFKEINYKDKVQIQDNRKYLKKFVGLNSYKEKIIDPNMAQKLNLCFIKAKSDCDLCSKCTILCPTGALKITEEAMDKKLLFDAGLCLNCDMCISSCNNLYKSDFKDVTLKELMVEVELLRKKFNKCPNCGEIKIENDIVCLECKNAKTKKAELLASWL